MYSDGFTKACLRKAITVRALATEVRAMTGGSSIRAYYIETLNVKLKPCQALELWWYYERVLTILVGPYRI